MDETETTIAAVRRVGPDAVAIDIETPSGFDARPGQFVRLSATVDGEDASRFYTLSSPEVRETFEVTVGIDPEGTLAPWLAEREAGDAVRVAGPLGNSYYRDEERVVVLAGGPGVGPAVGIAERARDDGHEAAVVYRDDAFVHEDRLDALADRGVHVALVDPDGDLAAATRDALDAAGEDAQVFVYGFADFLDAATEAIAAAGGDPDAALLENFG